jgi:hypothetical protein
MQLYALNYDILSNVFDFLQYVDLYELNIAILKSRWYYSLLKEYLQDWYININFNNIIDKDYYCYCDCNIGFNVLNTKKLLLWIFYSNIPVKCIEITTLYKNCLICNQKDESDFIDILFTIPAKIVNINNNYGYDNLQIIHKLNNALIKFSSCRNEITDLAISANDQGVYLNPDEYQIRDKILDWPILINLKKLNLSSLSSSEYDNKTLLNILKNAPNIEELEFYGYGPYSVCDELLNLQLIFHKLVKLEFNEMDNTIKDLNFIKNHFPNITYLNIYGNTEIDYTISVNLPETIENLTVDYNNSNYISIGDKIDILQNFNIHKLINLKILTIINHCDDEIVIDIMHLIHLPNLTKLITRNTLKNELYLPKTLTITHIE